LSASSKESAAMSFGSVGSLANSCLLKGLVWMVAGGGEHVEKCRPRHVNRPKIPESESRTARVQLMILNSRISDMAALHVRRSKPALAHCGTGEAMAGSAPQRNKRPFTKRSKRRWATSVIS